jgi:hypothetical protein
MVALKEPAAPAAIREPDRRGANPISGRSRYDVIIRSIPPDPSQVAMSAVNLEARLGSTQVAS